MRESLLSNQRRRYDVASWEAIKKQLEGFTMQKNHFLSSYRTCFVVINTRTHGRRILAALARPWGRAQNPINLDLPYHSNKNLCTRHTESLKPNLPRTALPPINDQKMTKPEVKKFLTSVKLSTKNNWAPV